MVRRDAEHRVSNHGQRAWSRGLLGTDSFTQPSRTEGNRHGHTGRKPTGELDERVRTMADARENTPVRVDLPAAGAGRRSARSVAIGAAAHALARGRGRPGS
jgi:hypothetical protein